MEGITSFMPLVLIFALMYFLLVRPQQKQKKKREELLNSLEKGDKVITIGGIYGIIRDIKGDVFTLEISKDIKINTTKNAIGTKRDK